MIDACLVLADSPAALVELCGISTMERLLRTLVRCGIARATVLSTTPKLIAEQLDRSSWPRAGMDLTLCRRANGAVRLEQIVEVWPDSAKLLLVVPADAVFDGRLLRLVISQSAPAVLVDSAVPKYLQPLVASAPNTDRGKLCGPALLQRDWAQAQNGLLLEDALRNGLENGTLATHDVAAQPSYSREMRRDLRPLWFPAPSPSPKKKLAERLLLRSTQKGVPDLPAWVHAPIENFLIAHLCKTPITPNQLTVFCNAVAWVTAILFATGQLAWGMALALVVGVLDGLDGKQARIKVETTHSGKFEHWFDALFEWSWWTALAYHFQVAGQLAGAFNYWLLLLAAEALDGTAKGIVYFKTGRTIDELNTFERMVRLVGGRRNVYVWILAIGVLLRAAEKAFMAMAWLEVATAVVHLPHAVWTLWRQRNQLKQPRQVNGFV